MNWMMSLLTELFFYDEDLYKHDAPTALAETQRLKAQGAAVFNRRPDGRDELRLVPKVNGTSPAFALWTVCPTGRKPRLRLGMQRTSPPSALPLS